MIFANVRLPDDIRIALEEDRLVVFAGAGVSMPPPSNLPDFPGLVSRICSVSTFNETEDRVLGKQVRNGTDVHSAAARILYNSKTKPTELHRQIFRVFGAAKKVRIVTTNFDDHFSAAARMVFKKEAVKEYCAPALPLGDDFEGIVYLHGSAKINPQAMVLTDKNFGEAYLTRGWARDFLISLFSKYTVLFVGYSHNDVTVSYLARGMNQAQVKPRFALVSSDLKPDAEENWRHLEIQIQQYPIDPSNKENRHYPLTDFFTGWAKHTQESIFDRSRKVKTIAAALPPESEIISEYLDYCLRHPQLAKDFCDAIRHPAWIGWMHTHNYFQNFFNDAGVKDQLQDHQRIIAYWLATFVRRKFPELLLEIIQKHHQRLSRPFSDLLGHALWAEQGKTPDPRFSIWVSLLLSQGEQALPHQTWAYLLKECRIPDHSVVALKLFELLTTPHIRLRKHYGFPEIFGEEGKAKKAKRSQKKVDFEIDWPESAKHWLGEAWKKVLQPNLSNLAEPLALIVTKQLTFAHLLLCDARQTDSSFDSLSWHRSSIAPHEQNRELSNECLAVLVDVARDLLIHWHKHHRVRAKAQMEVWWSSNITLLRRLTIYGVGIDSQSTADEQIEWILRNDLLFAFGVKKEVFDILAANYAQASVKVRKKLLLLVKRGHKGKLKKKLGAETVAYEQFNLLVWLRKADPTCGLVSAAIAEIQEQHPEFGEREHPEFDHWMGDVSFVDPKEGFDFDKILSEPASNYLVACINAADHSGRRDRWSYLQNLKELFARDKEWGKSFMGALAKENGAPTEIWSSVFWAWREVIKSREDWEWILAVAKNLPRICAAFSGVAGLISHGVFSKEVKLDDSTIAEAALLIDEAWNICSKVEEPPDDSFKEWLTSAINHEGGWIGEFWIHYCSHLRQRAGKKWKGIPSAIKSKIVDALKGTSRIKVYARIAMTPWMGYVFAWDKAFAMEFFLPLLDWKRDPIVAQQSWSVLLHYRRGTSVEMEQQLLPYYQQVADRMTAMLKDATEKADQFQLDDQATQNFGHYLAGVAMKVTENPVESGFFREFLPKLPEKVRGALAAGMEDFLKATPPEKVEKIWNLWLKEYMDSRLIGVPVALSVEETKAMAEWGLHLGEVFPEAVSRIQQMPLKNVFAYSIITDLLKNSVVEKFPKAACSYAIAVLKGEDYPHLHPCLLELHGKLKQKISGAPEIVAFEELLYLRGWKK